MGSSGISFLTAEFTDRATEQAFRASLHADAGRHARVSVFVASVFFLILWATDYVSLGASDSSYQLLVLRLTGFLAGIAFIAISKCCKSIAVFDRAVAAFELYILAAVCFIVWKRPDEPLFHELSMFVMVWAVYLIIPNPLRLMMLVGGTASVGFLAVSAIVSPSSPRVFTVQVLLLAMVNAFGAIAADRLHRSRRAEFLRLEAERAANEQLQQEVQNRLLAQSAMRDSEENIRRLFEAAPVPLSLTRLSDGQGLHANRAACNMFGVKFNAVGDACARDYYADPAVRDRLVQEIKTLGVVTGFEADMVNRDGDIRHMLISASTITFHGEPSIIVGLTDITERRKLEQTLRLLATTDPLTGMFNRRHFFELVGAEIERSRRYGHSLSLLMVDIDHFKRINDSYGHEAGDEALRILAGIFKDVLREADIDARLGGEEFGIALPETGKAAAAAVAERLRQAARSSPVMANGEIFRFSLSIGVTELGAQESSIHQALRRADHALYRAKKSGRDRVVLADEQDMTAPA